MNYNNKIQKYKWSNRILLLITPNYTNSNYKKSKQLYIKNIKEFHKRYIKLVTFVSKNDKFLIKFIGFDGSLMKNFNELNPKDIFKICDKITINELKKLYPKLKPKNLTLYSNYNEKNYTQGLGYKNKDKAIYTVKTIKSRDINYQINLLNTMIGRAKNHPHKTPEMNDDIKILQKRLDEITK